MSIETEVSPTDTVPAVWLSGGRTLPECHCKVSLSKITRGHVGGRRLSNAHCVGPYTQILLPTVCKTLLQKVSTRGFSQCIRLYSPQKSDFFSDPHFCRKNPMISSQAFLHANLQILSDDVLYTVSPQTHYLVTPPCKPSNLIR